MGWRWCAGAAAVVLAAGTGLLGQALSADEARQRAYGQHLAGECTSCHRIDGTDNGIPSIIGWDRSEFIATMSFYKQGQRTNAAMQSVAQSLEDAQVEALAIYFGSLPKPPRKGR